MRVNGEMIRPMVMEFSLILTELDTKVSGLRICSMAKVQRRGTAVLQDILANFSRGKSTGKVDLNGKTAAIMRVISWMDSFKVLASIILLT